MVGCLVRQSLETEENASPENVQSPLVLTVTAKMVELVHLFWERQLAAVLRILLEPLVM